mgnify:CR=1 FL=1
MAVELPSYLEPDVAAAAEKRLDESIDLSNKSAKKTAKLGAQGIAAVTSAIISGGNPAVIYAATQKAGEVAENVTGALRGVEGDAGKLLKTTAGNLLPDKRMWGKDDPVGTGSAPTPAPIPGGGAK